MSNVNQAFIRAYAKERRQVESGNVNSDPRSPASNTFTSAKKDAQGNDSTVFHRLSPAEPAPAIPEPWVSTVEVVGIMQAPVVAPVVRTPAAPVKEARVHPSHAIPANHLDSANRPEPAVVAQPFHVDTVMQSNVAAHEPEPVRTTLRDYIEQTRSEQMQADVPRADTFRAPVAQVQAPAYPSIHNPHHTAAHPSASPISTPKTNSFAGFASAPSTESRRFSRQDSGSRGTFESQRSRQAEEDLRAMNRSTSPAIQPKPYETIHPVWEVDHIFWPEITDHLLEQEHLAFHQVGRNLRMTNETGLKILAVTSVSAGVGRSTVSMCLARTAANAGLKVALVDADLANPSLGDQLNLEFPHGWEESFSEQMPLDEVAIQSLDDGITVFPLSASNNSLNMATDHPKLRSMLKQIAQSFDLVILDCNHLGIGQGKILGTGREGVVDAAILVIDGNDDRDDLVSYAMERLQQLGVDSVGLVENNL